MRRALLALLLLPPSAPCAPARDALSAVDACSAALDAKLDVGYEKVAARCPELAPSLLQSPWAAWLPRDWDKPGNNLSAAGLRELHSLIEAESRRAAATSEPQAAHVAAVLAALAPAEGAERSWWERLKDWVRDMLTLRPQPAANSGWVALLSGALRASWVRFLALGTLALVAVIAGAMVVTELRAAGLLRVRARPGARGAGAAAVAAIGWRQVETAAPAERPRLLLELIAARLAELGRAPPARALTVHELLRAARVADAADRARLAELALACERLRFSGEQLPPETLAGALERGRELLDGLDAARA